MGECDKKTTFEILDFFWDQGGYVMQTMHSIYGAFTDNAQQLH